MTDRTSQHTDHRAFGDGSGWLVTTLVIIGKLLWASLFAGLILAGIVATKAFWPADAPIYRYDALVIYAVGLQVLFLWLRLETFEEARVIILFNLAGTAMELFKVNAGSWDYPEPGILQLSGVPLFAGFMYASVGSFIARAVRLFDMQFAPYPPFWTTVVLAVVIYINFFARHALPDIRLVLFAATVVLFFRTRVGFTMSNRRVSVPMLLAAFITSFALWVAENIGTYTGTWTYPGQGMSDLVSFQTMGSWYLLSWVCFVTVTLVSRDALGPAPGSRA